MYPELIWIPVYSFLSSTFGLAAESTVILTCGLSTAVVVSLVGCILFA